MHIVRSNLVAKDAKTHREKKRRCANDYTTSSIRMPCPAKDADNAKNQTDQIAPEKHLEVIVDKTDPSIYRVIEAHCAKATD
jgi:hypothetical protein